MKLLTSVESTTILIDNQLCVAEGELAFAKRDLSREEQFSTSFPCSSLMLLLSYPMDMDPLKI
jgi:hypothetical protein